MRLNRQAQFLVQTRGAGGRGREGERGGESVPLSGGLLVYIDPLFAVV